MKKSLSTKILAMFLSVLMLVTAIPFASYAAVDLDDPNVVIEALNDVIADYTKKMDGTIYTGMASAYTAYINAAKARDSFLHSNGTSKVTVQDLKDKTDALQSAMDSMQKYTLPTSAEVLDEGKTSARWKDIWAAADKPQEAEGGARETQLEDQESVNLLYQNRFSAKNPATNKVALKRQATKGGSADNAESVTSYIYYGDAVLLYTGETDPAKTPRFPVMFSMFQLLGGFKSYVVFAYACYPADGPTNGTYSDVTAIRNANAQLQSKDWDVYLSKNNDDGQLKRGWVGKADWNTKSNGEPNPPSYARIWDMTGSWSGPYVEGTAKLEGGYRGSNSNGASVSDSKDFLSYYASAVRFKGTMDDDEFVRAPQIIWHACASENELRQIIGGRSGNWNESYGWTQANYTTYVVNYKAIENAIKKTIPAIKMLDGASIDKYNDSSAELLAVMQGIDKITGLDLKKLKDYDGDINSYMSTLKTDLENANQNFKDANKLEEDKDANYPALWKTIEKKNIVDTYNAGNDYQMYEKKSWATFINAYDAALIYMADLGTETGKYEKEKAGEVSLALNTAFADLIKYDPASSKPYLDAREDLIAAIGSANLSKEIVAKVKADLENDKDPLTFWELTETDFAKMVPNTKQSDVDAEKDRLVEAREMLLSAKADSATYEAIVAGIETLNADSIDFEVVTSVAEDAKATISEEGTILGVKFTAYDYETAQRNILDAISSNKHHYKIKAIDSEGTTYLWDGSAWIYNGDGSQDEDLDENGFLSYAEYYDYNDTVDLELDEGNFGDGIENASWEISSKAEKTQLSTKPQYIGTGASQSIVIKGNTTIYLSSTYYTDEPYTSPVKFVDANGKVLSFAYTEDGTLSIEDANLPKYAFYEPTVFACDDADVVIENGIISNIPAQTAITITVGYTPVKERGEYSVTFINEYGEKLALGKDKYKYNEYIDVEYAAAEGWAKAEYNDVTGKYTKGSFVASGNHFGLVACENLIIMVSTTAPTDINVNVIQTPVTTDDRAYFVGSFTGVPEGAEVLSAGIVLDRYNTTKGNLSLAKVDNAKGIYNIAAEEIIETNQYLIYTYNTKLDSEISYAAYVIYRPAGQKMARIAYSDVVTTTVQY